jgi:hypothetical protein
LRINTGIRRLKSGGVLASLEPADADPAKVACQIVRVVDICTPVANQIGIPISIVV